MNPLKEKVKVTVFTSKGAFVNQGDGILAEDKPGEK